MRRNGKPKETFWDHSRWTERDELDNEVRDRLGQVKSREILRSHRRPCPNPDFSGLVDIRGLAAASRSELQVDGNAITLSGLPSAAARPPLLPVRETGISTEAKVGVGALAVAAVTLLVLLGVLLLGGSGEPASGGALEPQQLSALMLAALDPPEGTKEARSVPAPGPIPGEPAAAADRAPKTTGTPAARRSGEAATRPRRKPAQERKLWRHDELDALLGGALPSREEARPKRSRGADRRTDLPATLGRAQVRSGLAKVSGRVKRKCGSRYDGLVTVEVVIGKNGRVTRARPTGSQAGTDAGRCAARAARKARFPRFDGQPITVQYPFRL